MADLRRYGAKLLFSVKICGVVVVYLTVERRCGSNLLMTKPELMFCLRSQSEALRFLTYELINSPLCTITIVICCLSSKQAALRNKSKDWLTLNQENASTKYGNILLKFMLFV